MSKPTDALEPSDFGVVVNLDTSTTVRLAWHLIVDSPHAIAELDSGLTLSKAEHRMLYSLDAQVVTDASDTVTIAVAGANGTISIPWTVTGSVTDETSAGWSLGDFPVTMIHPPRSCDGPTQGVPHSVVRGYSPQTWAAYTDDAAGSPGHTVYAVHVEAVHYETIDEWDSEAGYCTPLDHVIQGEQSISTPQASASSALCVETIRAINRILSEARPSFSIPLFTQPAS